MMTFFVQFLKMHTCKNDNAKINIANINAKIIMQIYCGNKIMQYKCKIMQT